MVSLDNSLSSLRAAGRKGYRDGSLSSWGVMALPITDGLGVWNPSNCGMPERELLLVDEAHFVGYLLGLANSTLARDVGNQ